MESLQLAQADLFTAFDFAVRARQFILQTRIVLSGDMAQVGRKEKPFLCRTAIDQRREFCVRHDVRFANLPVASSRLPCAKPRN